MSAHEVVQKYLAAFNEGDYEKSGSFLADDFTFSGPVPEPVGKDAYVGMNQILKAAFSDIDYGTEIVGGEGNVIKVKYQLSGTHTGDFNLTSMGMDNIPATGKSFSNKAEVFDFVVEGNKIASISAKPTEGAGLMAILAQIGVQVPQG